MSEVVHSDGVSVVRVVGLPDEIHKLPQMRHAPADADTNAVARAHTRKSSIFTRRVRYSSFMQKKKKTTRERDARALRAALTGPADGTDRGDVSRALGTSEAPPSPVVSAPDDHEVSVAVQHLPAGVVMVLLHTKAAGGSGAKH